MENIKFIQRPDSVSWDEIHAVLYAAHSVNLAEGFCQATGNLSGKDLADTVGNGVCFIAMDGDKVIGTASVKKRSLSTWFSRGDTAYFMAAGVLPEYQGKGVYKTLNNLREAYVKEQNIAVSYCLTHEKNVKIQNFFIKHLGFKKAGYIAPRGLDYFSILMVRWDNPPSAWYVSFRYYFSRIMTTIFNCKRKIHQYSSCKH